MSAHVQLVDPGGRFEHPQGTLTNDAVLYLPLDKRVKAGLQGRILRRVEAPATDQAPTSPPQKDELNEPEPVAPVTAPRLTGAAKRAATEAAAKGTASQPAQ